MDGHRNGHHAHRSGSRVLPVHAIGDAMTDLFEQLAKDLHIVDGLRCAHHNDCRGTAIVESNNEVLLCQEHAKEYRPCDSCDVDVHISAALGYRDDYLCPDCYGTVYEREQPWLD